MKPRPVLNTFPEKGAVIFDMFSESLGHISALIDTVGFLTNMGLIITALAAPFWMAGFSVFCLAIFVFTFYFGWSEYKKEASSLNDELDRLNEEHKNLEEQLAQLNLQDQAKEIATVTIKASFAPAIKQGIKMAGSVYGTLLGIVWGGMWTLSVFVPAVAVLSAVPIIGWSILGVAILAGIGMGCWWAYYTHQNTKRKVACQNLENQNKQLTALIDANTNKVKPKEESTLSNQEKNKNGRELTSSLRRNKSCSDISSVVSNTIFKKIQQTQQTEEAVDARTTVNFSSGIHGSK